MYLADYHTHSRCSPDGSATVLEMAQAAEQAGLAELCITDHCDLLTFDGKPDRSFRWQPIEEEVASARAAVTIPISMGLELGEAWEDPAEAARITSHPGLDFVIGSVHNQSSSLGGQDFYFVHYDSEAVCHAVLEDYFTCMEALSRLDSFDVLGHIIYPLRYMNHRDGNHITLEPYFDRLQAIFRRLIAKGKGIEVNTCRGETVEDWRQVLTLYKDCGGEIVTLGSDAHCPQDVGKGIQAAAQLIKELGFPYLATYQQRKPVMKKL